MKKNLFLFSFIISMVLVSCFNGKEQELSVKWASFNIRYDNPEDSLNNWKYRKDTVANFIKDNNITIVGMQEVLHHQLLDLQERLPEYDFVGVGRDDGKEAGEYAPIFFRKDMYEKLDGSTFWLSEHPDSAGYIGWDGACCRIATWAKLKEKTTGKIFMAVNTHFDHVGVLARKNAALLIIDKIQEIVGEKPAVLTGDFNVSDTSQAYKTITTNEFVLKDSHKTATNCHGRNYTFHDFGKEANEDRQKIDFIFITPSITCDDSWIPEEPTTEWGYISDHNPVVATLNF